MALEVWWAAHKPNSFCWTSVTCHKYCESGSRGCLAGCRRAPSFSKACDFGISATLWFAPPKKKKNTREMHLLRRFTVGNGRTRFYFLAELYLLFKMAWSLQWGFLAGFCVALYFSVSRNSVFHACTVILQLVHDFWLRKGLSLYKLWDFLPL